MVKDIILKIDRVNKRFGSTHANKDISLEIRKGEIHGLAGENGSGKSTLVSILSGIYHKDSGEIYKDGALYEPKSIVDANKAHVGIVVQELGMVQTIPIGVNMFLGRLQQFTSGGALNYSKLYEAGSKVLEQWGLGKDVPLRDRAGNHSVETRKLAEIARALSIDPDILIIDEATQALSQDKRAVLYRIIEEGKKQGKTIIMITHDLEEMVEMTDRISVLRDGSLVGTVSSSDIDADGLKRLMVGRELSGEYYRTDSKEDFKEDIVLSVKGLSCVEGINDVSFDLHKSEILAVCGLSDAGIHALGKAIIGLYKQTSGSVMLAGRNALIKSPVKAMQSGFCYVPKDRDGEAMMLSASIKDNFCMTAAKDLSTKGAFMRPSKMRKYAEDGIKKFEVKATGHAQVVGGLSGGNKQKINLGRWLLRDPEILLLDCPTRGVDVGVKAYIYNLLREAKKKDLGVILISDELPEAIGMADRILILKNGCICCERLRSEGFTEESIVEVMM